MLRIIWKSASTLLDDGFKIAVLFILLIDYTQNILNWTFANLHRPFQTPRKTIHFDDLLATVTDSIISNQDPSLAKYNRWKISIHIFAWRREKSLRRLCDSLLRAKFFGYEIPLHVHIDGDPLESVVDYAKQLYWPHGPKYINKREARLGMPRAILNGWNPIREDEYAILLEDDVEVAVGFFEFALYCLEFSNYKRMAKGDNHGMMGCSLYTPKVNEIGPAPNAWSPPPWYASSVIGHRHRLFYFQLPCSWGAIYHAKYWLRFLRYFEIRQEIDQNASMTGLPFPETPNSRSNEWFSSWKRILIELMLFEGWYLLYPSFPNQVSFSTNYFERGIHSVAEGIKPEIPDELSKGDRRFTVPLWTDFGFRASLPTPCVGLIDRIPFVNLYHSRVLNRQQLLLDVQPFIKAISSPPVLEFFFAHIIQKSSSSSDAKGETENSSPNPPSALDDLVDFNEEDDA